MTAYNENTNVHYEDVVGINETELNDLIIDINDYAERTKRILADFEEVFNRYIDFFDCEIKDAFKTVHETNANNYSILEKNILSYSQDLIAAKKRYQNIPKNIEIFNQNQKDFF